jgi:hypothetical protein
MHSPKSVKRLRGGQQPMQVAVLFAGRITGYENVLDKMIDIKNKYSPTYYCSLNKPAKDEEVERFSKDLGISPENINTESTPLPDFLNAVKDYKSTSQHNGYSMFYHQNKAFSLIEKDVIDSKRHIDCVLYMRSDIDSPDKLDLEMPKQNTIYIPEGFDYGGYNDRTAYGNFDAMKKYCSLITTLTSPESMNGTNPEAILKLYLESQKLEIVRFKYKTCLRKERNKKGHKEKGCEF